MTKRALVLFGSAADEPVVLPILEALRSQNIDAAQFYVSAHRSPEKLETILKQETYDFIVAGAGLAAHLPGVTASKTFRPVIGVPVPAAFGGFDAVMNILQMPTGIPVFTAAPLSGAGAKKLWKDVFTRWMQWPPNNTTTNSIVCFVGNRRTLDGDLTRKARAILDAAKMPWSLNVKPRTDAFNIVAAPVGRVSNALKLPKKTFGVFVPLLSSAQLKKPEFALTIYKNMLKAGPCGLWTGANNFTNAVCLALQMQNQPSRYDGLLSQVKKGEFRG